MVVQICFATCFDEGVLAELRALEGSALRLEPAADDLRYTKIAAAEVQHSAQGGDAQEEVPSGLSIKKKTWAGKYAVAADDFNPDLVRAARRTKQGRLRGCAAACSITARSSLIFPPRARSQACP